MPGDFADETDDGLDQPTADNLYLNADGDVLTGTLFGENSSNQTTILLFPEMAYLSLRGRFTGTETAILDGGLEGSLMLKSSDGFAQVNLSANANRGLMQLFDDGTKMVEFDAGKASADDKVALPEGSINPLETSREAGVATVVSPSSVQLGTVYGPVDSISIDVPGGGIVIVTATGRLNLDPGSGIEYLKCSISQNSSSESAKCAYYYEVPGAVIGRSYFQPLSLTYVDNVAAAETRKYYLGGISNATYGGYVTWLTMTAIYYPTAYGDIEETELSKKAE